MPRENADRDYTSRGKMRGRDLLFFYSLVFFWLLSSCAYRVPSTQAYQSLYAHLENPPDYPPPTWTSDYFLIIYVDAPHLDYTDNYSFLHTVACHPRDGSTRRDFGHVWIYLQGVVDDNQLVFYGGHSGEKGIIQAKYFDGIMNYIDYGYANPTPEQMQSPRYEPNPARYLWETQNDGFFEHGSGNHTASFAAKIDLSKKQFQRILDFIQHYDYTHYALTGNQCSTFAAQIASLAGLNLACEITIPLNRELFLKGERIRFWTDPCYSMLTIASPDMIERSLMQAVRDGKAQAIEQMGSSFPRG